MILRRVIKHFRHQEWTAIFLDFLIVVGGVFVGLQAQQFAVDRENRRSEVIYLNRLHEEVLQTLQLREGNVGRRFRTKEALNNVYRILLGDGAHPKLSEKECHALTSMHIMSEVTADLPTLTELLSAGKLDTIRSTEVRSNLIRYLQERDRSGDALETINKGVSPLYQRHPELIELRGKEDTGEADYAPFNPECHVLEMRNNRAFLNDFVGMRIRYLAYVGWIETTSEGISRLHDALDQELGIVHDHVEESQ
ncbi:MAG: hypothetical protein COA47_16185 [Robiginitomaculum sp.]|nr:MAG: hypothetical protein COA47_16185 [Robiginitomaculum sp.]